MGERLGRGQVGVSATAIESRASYWRGVRAARAWPGCCCSSSSPPTRCWRSRSGRVDFLFQPVPDWNPPALEPRLPQQGILRLAARRRVLARGPQHARLRGRLAGAVLRDRLPGRLLRRPARQALQGAADRAAGDPVLGQLPAADARLDRPAVLRRLRQPGPAGDRDRPPAGLAQRQRLLGDPGPRLRLHPLLHPAGVRRPGPDRPQPDRGRARPRRHPVARVPARHPAAQPAEHPRRRRRSSCCRCSATTTPTT